MPARSGQQFRSCRKVCALVESSMFACVRNAHAPSRGLSVITPDLLAKLARQPNPSDRLKLLREAAGYQSAAEAARAMGVKVTSYSHHENGRRKLTVPSATAYARFFDVSPPVLLYGMISHRIGATVRVAGSIGLGAVIVDTPAVNLPEAVDAPPFAVGVPLLAFVVLNDALYPHFRNRDVIYYSPVAEGKPSPVFSAGAECVVERLNGERSIRFCTQQADGRYTLMTYAGAPEPDVVLKSASPVLWIQRNGIPPS